MPKLVKNVYIIDEQGENTYWREVGVAFENKDGSINVKLHWFPNLQLQIRDRKQSDKP